MRCAPLVDRNSNGAFTIVRPPPVAHKVLQLSHRPNSHYTIDAERSSPCSTGSSYLLGFGLVLEVCGTYRYLGRRCWRGRRSRRYRVVRLQSASDAEVQTWFAGDAASTEADEDEENQHIIRKLRVRRRNRSVPTSDEDLRETLRTYFQYEDFQQEQLKVVKAVLEGQDTMVFWATGSGKSLCYQLPAVHLAAHSQQIVVVVSPLKSLMFDQVTSFNETMQNTKSEFRACYLNSDQSDPYVEKDAVKGKYCLVYVTPETLTQRLLEGFARLYEHNKLALFAVDEADRIPQWGHDFRPPFRDLWWIKEEYPGIPFMALSGAAPRVLQEDIRKQLRMTNPLISQLSFYRPNLHLTCRRKRSYKNDLTRIASELARTEGSAIVYVPTRMAAEAVKKHLELQECLVEKGVAVRVYHGETGSSERKRTHSQFLTGDVQVIVATVAFGMGIDHPNIRRIYIYGAPKNMEDYVQQIGRAGRDGKPATCELITNISDFDLYYVSTFTANFKDWVKDSDDDSAVNPLDWLMNSQRTLERYAFSRRCRWSQCLEYLGEAPSSPQDCECDVCTGVAETVDGRSKKDFTNEATVVLEATKATVDHPQTLAKLVSIIRGTWVPSVEEKKKSRKDKTSNIEVQVEKAKPRIQKLLSSLVPKRQQQVFFKELIFVLVSEGYLERLIDLHELEPEPKFKAKYQLSQLGRQTLKFGLPIRLPPSRRMKDLESTKEEQREKQGLLQLLGSVNRMCQGFVRRNKAFDTKELSSPELLDTLSTELNPFVELHEEVEGRKNDQALIH